MGFTQTAQYVTISKKRCKPQPKKKLYVILCNRETMVVPVKADRDPWHNLPWFMGGTPQFFGGSREKTWEGPILTLKREVEEESRRTLELREKGEPVLFVPATDSDIKTYDFRYAVEWGSGVQATWPETTPELPPKQREMERLVVVNRSDMLPDWQDSVIISRLVHATDTVNAPRIDQFPTSHTAKAFVTFIRDIWHRV